MTISEAIERLKDNVQDKMDFWEGSEISEDDERSIKALNIAIKSLEAVNDIGLTEIYVNLKNYDFDTCGNYKMDKKEAEKFVRVYKEIRGIE